MNRDVPANARTLRNGDSHAGLKALGEIAIQLQQAAAIRFQQLANGTVNREVVEPFIAVRNFVDASEGGFQTRIKNRFAGLGRNVLAGHCGHAGSSPVLQAGEKLLFFCIKVRDTP
ncbi:MAG: hypothetical protein HY735_23365 [Verrucomicrobia bacterium]|nr:hypothetical protein [Verrucomicrobiota bacterium]